MADKNVKAELNAEDLEGVAGGASVNVPNDPNGIRNHGIDVLESMKPTLDVKDLKGEKTKEKMSQVEDYMINHQLNWKRPDNGTIDF